MPKNYQIVLAFAFAIHEINKNAKLLPNITLGSKIYDNSFNSMRACANILDLLFMGDLCNYNCGRENRLMAIIEGLSFHASMQMANLLNTYKIPQLFSALRSIHFNNSAGEEIFFDENGDLAGGYDIINLVTFSNQTFHRVQVGKIDVEAPAGKQFFINGSLIVQFPMLDVLRGATLVIAGLLGRRNMFVAMNVLRALKGEFQAIWLFSALRNIHFNNSAGEEIFFDENGDLTGGYDIINLVTFSNQTFQRVQVGKIDVKAPAGKQFFINGSAIVWNHKFQKV
ncbi:hypothetical protein JD844_001183 [Phrynosoma platyrhinos]|uniref:Receptor ligand binding region domain-containing protein n=1 Tax=Phrynosoma platyrhinos TaxID=52577 RepID=A0ABQ7T971_PHRPL|nr:hypothetical protein JD844_001183 [Phrynosoma platyrhinos]